MIEYYSTKREFCDVNWNWMFSRVFMVNTERLAFNQVCQPEKNARKKQKQKNKKQNKTHTRARAHTHQLLLDYSRLKNENLGD